MVAAGSPCPNKDLMSASVPEAPAVIACRSALLVVVPVMLVALPVAAIAAYQPLTDDGKDPKVAEKKANAEKTEHLQKVLADSVLMRIDETLADAFKSELGWKRPTLTSGCPIYDSTNQPAQCIQVTVERIELLEQVPGRQTAVLCARARVWWPKLRKFETCRYENWESEAMYSKGGDEAAMIARLAKLTTQLGSDMAKAIIQ
jgi:hypothetical protein